MDSDNNSFDAAILAHDEAVAASGIEVWTGAEPTFTDRQSEAAEWLSEALGDSKQSYACHIIKQLRHRYPGSIILRTLGRQYPDEPRPRWSLGLYRRRDGQSLAENLPLDPLDKTCNCAQQDMIVFWQALTNQLDRDARTTISFRIDADQPGVDKAAAGQVLSLIHI